MHPSSRPFVHLSIDAVDLVAFDPEGRYDSEVHDRYPTFEAARDAALSCVELILHEGDYDGEDHREELERMFALLEAAPSFDLLADQSDYRWFLRRLEPLRPAAA